MTIMIRLISVAAILVSIAMLFFIPDALVPTYLRYFDAARETEASGLRPCVVCGQPANRETYENRGILESEQKTLFYCAQHTKRLAMEPAGKSFFMQLVFALVIAGAGIWGLNRSFRQVDTFRSPRKSSADHVSHTHVNSGPHADRPCPQCGKPVPSYRAFCPSCDFEVGVKKVNH